MNTELAGEARVSGKAWLTLAILLFMLILSYLDRGIIALLVQPLRKDLHIDDVQVSVLYGMAFALFYAIFSFPLGWLADGTSRKGVIYFCISGWSLATTACGLAHTFMQFAVARFGVGIGEGGLSPAAYRMIATQFPRRRLAFALGVFGAGASLGTPLALIVGGQVVKMATAAGGAVLPLIGAVKPWQLVFLVLGPPGLLIAPLIFLAPKEPPVVPVETPAADRTEADGGYLAFLRSRWKYLTLHFSAFALVTLVSYGMGAWNVTYFLRHFRMPIEQVTLIMGLVGGIFGLIGFVGSGWLADRWFSTGVKDAHLRYFAYGMPVVVVSAVIAYGLAPSPVFAFAPLALVNMLMPFTGPAVGHLQLCTPPQYRGRTAALFTMIFNVVGMVLGPTVVAILTEKVFHDPTKVGLSLATMFAVVGGASIAVFFVLLKPAREAVLPAG